MSNTNNSCSCGCGGVLPTSWPCTPYMGMPMFMPMMMPMMVPMMMPMMGMMPCCGMGGWNGNGNGDKPGTGDGDGDGDGDKPGTGDGDGDGDGDKPGTGDGDGDGDGDKPGTGDGDGDGDGDKPGTGDGDGDGDGDKPGTGDGDGDGDGDGGNGSDGSGDYPLGAVAFFPHLAEPPSEKWVVCDGERHRQGTYPDMDALYKEKHVLYHVDKRLTGNATSNEMEVTSSNNSAYAYYLFQDSYPYTAGDGWTSAVAPTDQVPQWVGLELKTTEAKFLGVELRALASRDAAVRRFPSRVRLMISTDGGETRQPIVSDVIHLEDPGPNGIVRINLSEVVGDNVKAASRFYLEIYESHAGTGVGLSRMHIFAQENSFIAPTISEVMGPVAQVESKGVWCIRVAK